MVTEDLKCYISLVDKVEDGFEKIDFHFKRSSAHIVNSITWYKTYFMKQRIDDVHRFHCCLILRNCHPTLLPMTTTLISQQPSTWKQKPLGVDLII